MLNMIESWLDSYQSTLTKLLDFTDPCSPFIPTQAFREVAEGLTSYALGDHTDDIEWGSMCQSSIWSTNLKIKAWDHAMFMKNLQEIHASQNKPPQRKMMRN